MYLFQSQSGILFGGHSTLDAPSLQVYTRETLLADMSLLSRHSSTQIFKRL